MVNTEQLNKKNIETIQSLIADLKEACEQVEEGADDYFGADDSEEREDAREQIDSGLNEVEFAYGQLTTFTQKL